MPPPKKTAKKTPAPKVVTRGRGGRFAAASKPDSDSDPDDSSSAAASSTPSVKASTASRYGTRGVNRDADEVPLVIDEGWSFFDFPSFSMLLRSFPVNFRSPNLFLFININFLEFFSSVRRFSGEGGEPR